jgi:MFS family permease
MAGRFYPTKPAKLMGKMTLSYGVAQIIAPAFTGIIAERTGNYDIGLWLAAAFVFIGAIIIAVLRFIEVSKLKDQ